MWRPPAVSHWIAVEPLLQPLRRHHVPCHTGASDRTLCGYPSRYRSRAQVRRSTLSGEAARTAHATRWEGSRAAGQRHRTGSASSGASARARFQSSCRSRPPHRTPRCARTVQSASNAFSNDSARHRSPRERLRCVPGDAACARPAWSHSPRCRRCADDGGDAGGVCECVERRWRTRGSGTYGCASRVVTALNTSAATSSFERSPSRLSQAWSDAWRR